MDDQPNTTSMIALLPATSFWCKKDLPHLTLVYAGEIKDRDPGDYNMMAKDAASIAMLTRPLTLSVKEVDVFGEETKVDVLTFQMSSELEAIRHAVKDWDESDYDKFKPHATMGPVGTRMLVPIPEVVTFDRIYVGWGEECLTFWLKMAGF